MNTFQLINSIFFGNCCNFCNSDFCLSSTPSRFPVLLFFFALFSPKIQAQIFQNFFDRNGAPVTTVMEITQDQEGFMWFATVQGLYRYDSRTFRAYTPRGKDPDAIGSSYVNQVICDSRGTLWAATSSGLSRYNKATDSFTTFRHDAKDPHSLASDRVSVIVEDRKKKGLWVGTSDGLYYLNLTGSGPGLTRIPMPGYSGCTRQIRCLVEEADGRLWIGTSDGLVRMDPDGARQQVFRMPSDPTYPALSEFTTLYADGKGSLWLGSNRVGLFRFDIATEKFQAIEQFRHGRNPLPNVWRICSDGTGKMWIATWSGLALFDPHTFASRWFVHKPENPYSLPDDLLFAFYQDRQGGIWIGSYLSGICYMTPGYFGNLVPPEEPALVPGMESVKVGWMEKTRQGTIWGVTENRSSAWVRDARTHTVRTYPLDLPFSRTYNAFYLDETLTLWCGGNAVLTSYHLPTGRKKSYSFPEASYSPGRGGTVLSLFEDSENRLWIGGVFGLLLLDKKTDRLEKPFARSQAKDPAGFLSYISFIMEDSRQNTWFGGRGEVFVLRRGAAYPERIGVNMKAEMNMPSYVWAIREDRAGRLWFALGVHGLQLYRPGRKQLEYREVPDAFVQDLQSDSKGYLWLNNSAKLIRYHPDAKTIQYYDSQDGIPMHGVILPGASVKDQGDNLYWATSKGIFMVRADRIGVYKNPSGLAITSLKLFNREVRVKDRTGLLKKEITQERELVFSYDQNVFTLDFALLSYFRSNRNAYAYRLKGFEENWNYTGTPSATFTNLSPGTYTFEVKAANGDGIWNKEPLCLRIIVRPPWWRTWYAYTAYLLVFSAALFFAVRYYWLRKSVQQENDLFLAKLDFFTNISHEIRTHLTLISAPLGKAFHSSGLPEETRADLSYAKANSDTLMELVNELLDFRKIQNKGLALQVSRQDLSRMLERIISSFEFEAKEKGIRLLTEQIQAPCFLWLDTIQMQKVFYNLLGNALKYTERGGWVALSVRETEEDVRIEIRDNGRGIDGRHLPHLFTNFYQVTNGDTGNTGYGIGLALAHEIVDRHHGTLTVTSRPASAAEAGDTCFVVLLKKGNGHFRKEQLLVPVLSETVSYPAEPVQMPGEDEEKRYTILLIEDNDDLRTFESNSLRARFIVLEADNGRDGLEMARHHGPDLIVCDIMLPGMNGLDICRTLKSDVETSHIPLILLSARGTAAQVMEGLEAGADDYLTKPFPFQTLELKIGNLIQAREILRLRYSKSFQLESGDTIVNERDGEFLDRLKELVLTNISDPDFGVNEIAVQIGASVSVLYRKLRSLTGMTVNDFMKGLRMKKAMQLLESGAYHINEVSLIVGYESSRHFSREFKKVFGKTPNEIKRKGS